MNARVRLVMSAVASVSLVAALAVLAWSAVSTSSARVSASTEAESFFSVGTISLESATSSRQLLFDTPGLYPGATVEGCVEIRYQGSIPGMVRIFASPGATTGLDEFIDLELTASTSATGCADTDGDRRIFAGGLDRFWRTHSSYGTGLPLGDAMDDGSTLTLRATAVLADDNEAQGRTTEFTMMVEVRP